MAENFLACLGSKYETEGPPDLSQDEHFMVWMRTAGLPNFRKLYGRSITPNLDAGTWQIDVRSRTATCAHTGTAGDRSRPKHTRAP